MKTLIVALGLAGVTCAAMLVLAHVGVCTASMLSMAARPNGGRNVR